MVKEEAFIRSDEEAFSDFINIYENEFAALLKLYISFIITHDTKT